jgi:hypothetical protein
VAYSDGLDNDTQESALSILNRIDQEYFIIKYKEVCKRLFRDGSEKLLELSMYNPDSELSYIYKGLSFSFIESKRYGYLIIKKTFWNVVEFFSNNKWNEKLVENPLEEWDDIYKLMLKYKKLRVALNKIPINWDFFCYLISIPIFSCI